MSLSRIIDAYPTWTEWKDVNGTSTEFSNQQEINIDTVAKGNSVHKSFALIFESNFDNSIHDNVRIWMLNNPGLSGHLWQVKHVETLPSSFSSDDSVLPTNPDEGLQVSTSAAYSNVTKQLRYIGVNLSAASDAITWNQQKQIITNPVLVLEFSRLAKSHQLLPEMGMLDLEQGHLFTFSDVELYESIDQRWCIVGAIREDSFQINLNTEKVEWSKSKPAVVFHQAISRVIAEISFQMDQWDPRWVARALGTRAVSNERLGTVDIPIGGRSSHQPLVSSFVVQWRTYGGYIVRVYFHRAQVSLDGEFSPGDKEFSGVRYKITGLSHGANHVISTIRVTKTPTEQAMIPIVYNVQ